MHGASTGEFLTEKKCPSCRRGLARIHGPEIPCTLCVRLGPPSVRRKEPTLKLARTAADTEADSKGANERETL